MNIKELTIYEKTVAKRDGEFVSFPEHLSEELCSYLKLHGVKQLYAHQAEMYEKAQLGENIVITTATASGKTLSFLLPVIQAILHDPLTRAVFVYPTKALASDQYRALKPYLDHFGDSRLVAGVYDGDTSQQERSRIRKQANIILTNPEMLNGTFLPNHSRFGFDFIFSNLKYVIIDELHTYRGAFGSHLANVFRRLGRVCRYYRSTPQFLCSSATIANPLELAEGICGQPFVRIEQDGSPAAQRTYCLVQPPRITGRDKKYYGQVQAATVAADIIPQLAERDVSFLAFAKSRRNVEVILKEARDRLEAKGLSEVHRIAGYRGGYTQEERKDIEHRMIRGEVCGLVSTNALELGIDIGQLDATVIAGYPGTRASFWQQTGRAGRSGRPCTNYLILDGLPFDQYIAVNPAWLFEGGTEHAVIDKNNLLIELSHIRAAAAEIPLTLDDIAVFPDLGETIPVLLRVGEVTDQNGKFAWTGSSYPAGDFSLRNIDKVRYKLILDGQNKVITEMDEMQAFRELHDGAVYMHEGMQYQVLQLDLELKMARAVPFEGNYYTVPGGETQVRCIQVREETGYARTRIRFGDINVDDSIHMFKKLQFHNRQNLGYEQLPRPLARDFDTESVWIRIPVNVTAVYRHLLQEDQEGRWSRNNHFEGVGYVLKNAAQMVTMTEQEDIGYTMSGNALELTDTFQDAADLYIYDKYTGGLGYAEKIYDLVPEIIPHAIQMVRGCGCEDGCAACVGDHRLDKRLVIWGLENLLEETAAPAGVKQVVSAAVPGMQKQFRFVELAERWPEFCAYVEGQGGALTSFFRAVPKVEIRDHNIIRMSVQHAFYGEWVLEDTNRRSLISLLRYHTEAPADIRLEVMVMEQESNRRMVSDRLERRYNDVRGNTDV